MSVDSSTERQQYVLALAERMAAILDSRVAQHDRAGSFPIENYADLHESGYLRLALPEEFGGFGANIYEMVLAQERLAQGDSGTSLAVSMLAQLIGGQREGLSWPAPIFEAICRELVSQGGLINSIVTEADLGSISRGGAPATTATPTEGGWLINGHKRFATGAPALRFLATAVVLPPTEDAPKGTLATALVHGEAAGLELIDTWSGSLGMRTSGSWDVRYEQVFVADDWLVGRRPIGVPLPPNQQPGVNGWGMAVSATYLGIGQAAIRAACNYANNRVPSALGKPIAELPHIQQWIGGMQVKVDAARAFLYQTAKTWVAAPEQRPQLAAAVAAAKYLCTTAACEATDLGLRVAGGFSLSPDLPLERYFRDARAGLFNPPQDDLALGHVGRATLAAQRVSATL